MGIDPNVEQSARDLLGHAIRGEFDQFANVIEAVGEQRFLEAGSLCLRIAGYVAVDACAWRWPSDADVRQIAQEISALDNEFDLTEQDAHDYLARAVLRFEPILAVFPDPERAGTIPFFTTAALLIAYRREGRHWWEYLDVIEKALEDAAPLTEEAVPAVIFLARKTRALNEQKHSRPAL